MARERFKQRTRVMRSPNQVANAAHAARLISFRLSVDTRRRLRDDQGRVRQVRSLNVPGRRTLCNVSAERCF